MQVLLQMMMMMLQMIMMIYTHVLHIGSIASRYVNVSCNGSYLPSIRVLESRRPFGKTRAAVPKTHLTSLCLRVDLRLL